MENASRKQRSTPRRAAVLAAVALAVACLVHPPGALRTAAAQASFNDIADQPAEIQQAVAYAVEKGYMQGYEDGGFHPAQATSRIECARALVTVFGKAGEGTDPSITFTDLPASDPSFKWANLAVKHGYLERLPDGSFAPNQGVLFERVAQAATVGMELSDVAANVNQLTGGAPPYGGAMTVFMDLRLKYRYSKVWPGQSYPRGEMAFTLYRMDNVESWRPWYVRASFTPANCRLPEATAEQFQAVSFGFERLGCPYVYGGERESEGGFDCSGFVYNTLSIRLGYPMMRVADDQARDNRYLYVSRGALEPGDAIFFYEEADATPSSYIGHAGMYVGNGLFIHSTGSNGGVSIDCLDNNDYWGTHFAWGRRVVGGPYNDRFDTWLLLYNPSEGELPVEVEYMLPRGEPCVQEYTVAPHSRYNVPVDSLLPWDEFSMRVSAPEPGVVAERAMYFDYLDWADGGHASVGDEEAGLQGYFAEGYTGRGFHTWLLLANPGEEEALVEVSYLLEGSDAVREEYRVASHTRFTVKVNDVKGVGQGGVGIAYRSLNGVPVAAERAVYFDYHGIIDGHCSQAVEDTSTRLYLAEGYTGKDFDTWILLANPNPDPAEVEVCCLVQGGEKVSAVRSVPPFSRLTVNARELVDGVSFGIVISSRNGVGIVAERAMYFRYHGRIAGGHCSAAVGEPSQTMYLAEGYTGGDFDTWILLANPNGGTAHARVTFAREDGGEVVRQLDIPGGSRCSILADEVRGLEGCSFSTRVDSDLPLFVERSMYFFYQDRAGGTNCPALERPSTQRFFAEGYTGG
ncbi:MAG: NlpC/P60 family protein [Actinomycetota bacterium]|nr:NlpC/P60 family protein [Actinomycetota bacterium]